MLPGADAGSGEEARWQGIEGKQASVMLQVVLDGDRGFIAKFGVVRQDQQLRLGQHGGGQFRFRDRGVAEISRSE